LRRVALALLVFVSCIQNIQPIKTTTPASLVSSTQKTTQPTSAASNPKPPDIKPPPVPQPLAPLHTDWRWQSPSPQGNHLYGLHAIEDALFAVGRNGTIMRRGSAWSMSQSDTRSWLFDVFGNRTHLFAVGEGGVISRSTDGGVRWTTTSLSYRLIFFGGASRGASEHFIVGSQGTILHSKDNGERWTTLRSGDELLYQIRATSWGDLFVVGANGALLQSSDGASWKKTSLSREEDLLSVTSTQDALYLVGNKGTLWRSTDKGKTFTAKSLATKQLNGVWARERTVVIAGNNGLLLRSTDLGETWKTIKSPTSANLISLEETSERLVVVGALGVIAQSEDDGASWVLDSMGIYKTLHAADISQSRIRWEYLFVGASGSLYQVRPSQLYTYEESLRILTWGDLRGVKALSSGWIVAIGEVGGVFLSKDGGESWSFQQKTGPLLSLTGDDSRLTAVGAKGAIWSSQDQGQTWRQEESPTESTLRSIWQSASGDRFVLGERGVLLRSRQGGEWRSSVISSSKEPRSIWGFQDKELYIVGDGGLLLRSDNAGDLWQQQKIDTKEDLKALWGVRYDGHKALFIVGKDGLILRQQDASSWTQETTPTDEDLSFIIGSPSGELFAGGASGVLLVSSWRTD
jgi:photosystem II stability/assembly factor-like uncharacterized protein